jgi:hypothetical protein
MNHRATSYHVNQVIKIALREVELFNVEGVGYATVPVLEDGRESATWPVSSPAFAEWIIRRFIAIHGFLPLGGFKALLRIEELTLSKPAQPRDALPWLA